MAKVVRAERRWKTMQAIGDLPSLSCALRCECEEDNSSRRACVDDARREIMSFFRLSVACIALIQLSCYLEEWIFKALPGFHYHWTVALVELLFFTVAGWCGARGKRAAPLTVYAGIGCSLAAGTGLGKLAYRYLNFATGTVLKSMKLVPGDPDLDVLHAPPVQRRRVRGGVAHDLLGGSIWSRRGQSRARLQRFGPRALVRVPDGAGGAEQSARPRAARLQRLHPRVDVLRQRRRARLGAAHLHRHRRAPAVVRVLRRVAAGDGAAAAAISPSTWAPTCTSCSSRIRARCTPSPS